MTSTTIEAQIDEIFLPVIEYLIKTNSSIYPESLREFGAGDKAMGNLLKAIEAEKLKARLEESKGYCDYGHYHDYENDAAMLPSERVKSLQQQLDSIEEGR